MARCDGKVILKYYKVSLTTPIKCHLRNLLSDPTSSCTDVICCSVENNLQIAVLITGLNINYLILKHNYYTF